MLKSIEKHWQKVCPPDYDPIIHFDAADYFVSLTVALLAGGFSLFLSSLLDHRLYQPAGFDVWFQADPPRVYAALMDALSTWHYRTSVHPLFSILGTPAMTGLRYFGVPPIMSGRLLIALSGSVCGGALYLALRGLGIPKVASCIFACMLFSSATYMNWFCLIETYSASAASVCLMLLALTSARRHRYWLWLLASAVTLAVTVTDWAMGISAVLFRLGPVRALLISSGALLLVIALSLYQKTLYPNTQYFFNPILLRHEGAYTPLNGSRERQAWKPTENLRSMLLSSAVSPSPELVRGDAAGGVIGERILTNQHSPVATYTWSDWIAAGAWMILMIGGLEGGSRAAARRPIFLAIILFLVSQISIYLVYGPITFLYSCLFFPAMVLLAGFGWFSRMREMTICAAVLFVLFGAHGNFTHFKEAVVLANTALKP